MRVERVQTGVRLEKMDYGTEASHRMVERIPIDAAHERAVNDDHDNRPDRA